MRLLRLDDKNGDELSLVEFLEKPPRYAILSHTWGPHGTEVTYKDFVKGRGKEKAGYGKIQGCGRQSAKAGYKYFWIDTCCIDKTSSVELSEAINSMYRWYEEAGVCFAYLEDASPGLPLSEQLAKNIRWFSRGWTLQELIAPREVEFFASDWSALGTRTAYASVLSRITNIHIEAFKYDFEVAGYHKPARKPIQAFSIAQRMSWAAKRITKKPEDLIYCLLGIFDVNMPLLYGEGSIKAFIRLQEEIMKDSNDQTLFAWCRPRPQPRSYWNLSGLYGLLAESPSDFKDSGSFLFTKNLDIKELYAMTNSGLRITLKMARVREPFYVAVLDCVESKVPFALILAQIGNRWGRANIHSLDLRESTHLFLPENGGLPRELQWSSETIYTPKTLAQHPCYDLAVKYDQRLREGACGSEAVALVYHDAPLPWLRASIRPFGISIHFVLTNCMLLSTPAFLLDPTLSIYKYASYLLVALPVLSLIHIGELRLRKDSSFKFPISFLTLVYLFTAFLSVLVSRRTMIIIIDESFQIDKRLIELAIPYLFYHLLEEGVHHLSKGPHNLDGSIVLLLLLLTVDLVVLAKQVVYRAAPPVSMSPYGTGATVLKITVSLSCVLQGCFIGPLVLLQVLRSMKRSIKYAIILG